MAYGPPNYGEDPAHDAKEIYWYLELDDPICVNGKKQHSKEHSEEMQGENNLRQLQIVYMFSAHIGLRAARRISRGHRP
jgi:hypothetical protein